MTWRRHLPETCSRNQKIQNCFIPKRHLWDPDNIEARKNLFIDHLDGLVLPFFKLFQRGFVDTEFIYRQWRWQIWIDKPWKKKNWKNYHAIAHWGKSWPNISDKYESLYCKKKILFVTSYLWDTDEISNQVNCRKRVKSGTLPPRFHKLSMPIKNNTCIKFWCVKM